MTEIVLVLTTVPTVEDGARIGRTLVDEHLAACVHVAPPATSFYRWKGDIEEAVEHPLTIKTAADRVADVRARLRDLHPYELPELLVVPVAAGGEEYLAWITAETRR